MLNTKNIQKYLKEIELMPFAEAFETVKKYPDTVRRDVNMLQAVFVKLFMQAPEIQKECGKRYGEYCASDDIWDNLWDKDEILFCFKENFESLCHALQTVFHDGCLSFVEQLYALRIAPIFTQLQKRDELRHLYEILKEHEHSYNVICRGGLTSVTFKLK